MAGRQKTESAGDSPEAGSGLRNLILSLIPEDGSSIGNGAMLARLREDVPDLSEDGYAAARDALVDDGLLARGRGRGGSLYRADVADLELTAPEAPAASPATKRTRKKATRKSSVPTQVLSYRHDDTRLNNPEVGMVHAGTDPDGEKAIWAYDPHLDPVLNFDPARAGIEAVIDDALASDDPQVMKDALEELKRLQAPYLTWTGKAEKTFFEVDTVSLHVHERVDPATILAHAMKRLKAGQEQLRQDDLFAAPFETLPLRQALEFYRHEKDWSNRLVTGDSLLVMNSLLTRESMGGKVQMIYIDPPYGIKYGSNFQPFTNRRDVKDRADADLTQEPEMIRAFRDTWELGIHSYLSYLRDRLVLARDLLAESGSVFVQISDENVHLVRNILDEVFGVKNQIAELVVRKTTSEGSNFVGSTADFILWSAKDKQNAKFRELLNKRSEAAESRYTSVAEDGRHYRTDNITSSRGAGDGDVSSFVYRGQNFDPGNGTFKTTEIGLTRLAKVSRFYVSAQGKLNYIRYKDDHGFTPIANLWTDISGAVQSRSDPKVYVVQSSTSLIERCLLMTTDPGDLVLDPTCGSGTTAYVAEKWGRRWITCDTSRVAVTLARQRLMTASFDYYGLRYPEEGLKGGFDYETVPHITLRSIANNPEIDTIYDEDHPKIDAALADLNAALTADPPAPFTPAQGVRKGQPVDFSGGDRLHEWEVPFDWPEGAKGVSCWPEAAKAPFAAFHAARQAMQRRMDRSIAEQADQETLYDRPRIDRSRLRICGPFSVEAVPAPTVLSLDDALPVQQADATIARAGETSRQALWRDELLKTGVRGKGGAMLHFAGFETLPGPGHIHASGALAETGERVVVSFGPEHAALEQRQVELALSAAETLRPAPRFILFCAFTFDPEAAKDLDEVNWPGVTLLKAQMNTDLLTEDLKKKRASNQSFWLMGQPDVDLRHREGDGMWEVEVNGFDYFDPKAGDLVSGGKTQIAMWSLDSDYDGRSMMPHQVFFPMADAKGGWNRLRKTVRAELDADRLAQFHGTVSLPFEAGENRRIAVKIVDDRGIESLRVLPLGA